MDIAQSLGRFIESCGSDAMSEGASQLLELVESDLVEPLGRGTRVSAELLAERLETRLDRLKNRGIRLSDGVDLAEEALARLRANEHDLVDPWTYEDGEGVRWFVLANETADVIACYTSAPFIEADL